MKAGAINRAHKNLWRKREREARRAGDNERFPLPLNPSRWIPFLLEGTFYLLLLVLDGEIIFVTFLFSDKEHSEGTFKFNSMIAFQEKGGMNSGKREGENPSLFNFYC